MLDVLGTLGSIKAPSGTLEFGNVGQTACVFMRFVGNGDAVPSVVYTPEELAGLLSILGYAEKLSQTTQPGSILRLGAMRGKPIVLRIALIHPNAGAPFILLRMIQGRGKLDIPVPIATAISLFRKGEVTNPSPPACGMLRRDPNGIWQVAGKELHLVPGLSPGVGQFGEYLHPDEVREGEELIVWTYSGRDGKEYVGTFRTLEQWQPSTQVSEPMAQEGDVALFHGETYRCRQIHKTFAQKLLQSGSVDPAWAAKIALSTLLCDIADGEDEAGHGVWIGNSPDPVVQVGITAMEQGQTSPHDLAIYQQVSCYFHSLGADQESASQAVNTIMERLFDHISESEPQQRRGLLGNWAVHLKEIYDGKPPVSVSEPWKRCKARYPGRVIPKVISFPPPYPWVVDWLEQDGPADEPAAPFAAGAGAAPSANPHDSQGQDNHDHDRRPDVDVEIDDVVESEVTVDRGVVVKTKSANSKAPLLVGGILGAGLLLAGIAYKVTRPATAGPTPGPASPAIALATPAVPVTPVAGATVVSTGTPVVSPTGVVAMPTAAATTSAAPVVGDLGSLGVVSIGGINDKDKYFVDRDVEGMKMLEQGPGWARYEKDGFQVFLGAEISETRKSSRASAFASDALFSDGKKVLQAGTPLDQVPPAALERLKVLRIDVVADDATGTILGFRTGDFPPTTVALGQPLGSSLVQAFQNRDLATFRQILTPETANLTFMDGQTLFSKVAKEANVVEYCQALIDAGADVEGTVGSQAFWATADPAIVAMLTKAGLPVDQLDPQGKTKLFGAGPEMIKVLLAAGANPNIQDQTGASPLFAADDSETVAALLKAGAKPNQANGEGKTPLMGANLEVTKALLAGGADPSLKDKDGRSAIDYAGTDSSIVALLSKPPKPGKPAGK